MKLIVEMMVTEEVKGFFDLINEVYEYINILEIDDPVEKRNRKAIHKNFKRLKNYSSVTGDHTLKVALIVRNFIRYLNSIHEGPFGQEKTIVRGTMSHDFGKMKVKKDVPHKPTRLEPEERHEMDKHYKPESGFTQELLSKLLRDQKVMSLIAAQEHHTGHNLIKKAVDRGDLTYEQGRIARIILMCDIFEALTSEKRSYKEGYTRYDAVAKMVHIPVIDPILLKKFTRWQRIEYANEFRKDYVVKERIRLRNLIADNPQATRAEYAELI